MVRLDEHAGRFDDHAGRFDDQFRSNGRNENLFFFTYVVKAALWPDYAINQSINQFYFKIHAYIT